jgi:hypothetical protein
VIITRRKFLLDLSHSSAALLMLSSCAPFFKNTQLSDSFINDKPRYQLSPILQSLIATLIPMDDELFKTFPLSFYEQLLDEEFDFYTRKDLLFYRKALYVFNNPSLFTLYPQQLLDTEENVIDSFLEQDRANFLKWSAAWDQHSLFEQLPNDARQGYLRLWMHSPLSYKRTFFRVSKSLVYAAVFSQERFTSALGYAGPLLHREG